MSSLKFAFPGILDRAWLLTSNREPALFHSIHNLVRGFRGTYFRTASALADVQFTADLVTEVKRVEYVIIARADMLRIPTYQLTLTVRSANDEADLSSSASDVLEVADFQEEALFGNDYLIDLTTPGAPERFHRLILESSSNQRFRFAKAYIGEWFTFDSEPTDYQCVQEPITQYFVADDGRGYADDRLDSRHQGFLQFDGVSDDKAAEFQKHISPVLTGCFLYASQFPKVLNGRTLMHVEIFDLVVTKVWNNWNRVRFEFREQVG